MLLPLSVLCLCAYLVPGFIVNHRFCDDTIDALGELDYPDVSITRLVALSLLVWPIVFIPSLYRRYIKWSVKQ